VDTSLVVEVVHMLLQEAVVKVEEELDLVVQVIVQMQQAEQTKLVVGQEVEMPYKNLAEMVPV
tara:strand:+ start:331 stop:519 length:189 start_codon:yes stop_codon:yes gene_type:complete